LQKELERKNGTGEDISNSGFGGNIFQYRAAGFHKSKVEGRRKRANG
jgi:hypothetical protein